MSRVKFNRCPEGRGYNSGVVRMLGAALTLTVTPSASRKRDGLFATSSGGRAAEDGGADPDEQPLLVSSRSSR
jgi:hypothetical protein